MASTAQLDAAKVDAAKMVQVTDDARLIYLMDHPDSTEEIPVIDMGGYRAGEPAADRRMAAELRHVTETVGFFYLKNHGVPQSLIDRTFAEGRRFFALPLEEKRRIPRVDNTGYVELRETKAHSANSGIVKDAKPALNESFVINRERTPDDPDVIAGKMFCSMNNWPDNLPGYRETLLEYHSTLEALGKAFLPLWALSLDLPTNFFDAMFTTPHCNLRILHYPPQPQIGGGQYGITPHTDNCLMTFLAQSDVPGLAVQMPSGHWRAVDIVPGTLLINTGNLMLRWTNGRYKSTKHRVINTNTIDRYSMAAFFGPNFDALIEVVPTCQSAEKPAQFEPITYTDLRKWYYGRE